MSAHSSNCIVDVLRSQQRYVAGTRGNPRRAGAAFPVPDGGLWGSGNAREYATSKLLTV